MHTAILRKVGGSVMLAIPPAYLEALSLKVGAKVSVTIDSGRLVVEPQKRPRYTLDELLAQCNATADISDADREWIDAKPVWHELP